MGEGLVSSNNPHKETSTKERDSCMTHIMHTLIDGGEAPTANLLEASITTDGHPGV